MKVKLKILESVSLNFLMLYLLVFCNNNSNNTHRTKSFSTMFICNYFIYTVFMCPLPTCTLDPVTVVWVGLKYTPHNSVDLGCVFPLESSTTSIQSSLDPGVIVGSNGEGGSAVSAIVEGPDTAEELLVQALFAVEVRITEASLLCSAPFFEAYAALAFAALLAFSFTLFFCFFFHSTDFLFASSRCFFQVSLSFSIPFLLLFLLLFLQQ